MHREYEEDQHHPHAKGIRAHDGPVVYPGQHGLHWANIPLDVGSYTVIIIILYLPLAVSVIGGFVIALPLLLIVYPSILRIVYRQRVKEGRRLSATDN